MHSRPKMPSPKYYAEQFAQIKANAAPIMATIESGKFEWRDVAIATEYLQQFADVLDEMECNPPKV